MAPKKKKQVKHRCPVCNTTDRKKFRVNVNGDMACICGYVNVSSDSEMFKLASEFE
jgi:hypothetical protein